jgi:hypothetical protein
VLGNQYKLLRNRFAINFILLVSAVGWNFIGVALPNESIVRAEKGTRDT